MNTIDNESFEDLNSLPGWNALFSESEFSETNDAIVRSTQAVRATIAHDMSKTNLTKETKHSSSTSRWRRGVYLAAISAAAASVVIAAPIIRTHGNALTSVASAADFLKEMAATATEAPGLNDQYWAISFSSRTPENGNTTGATTFWFGRQGGRWITDESGKVIKSSSARAPFVLSETGALTWAEINSLPDTSGELERVLVEKFGQESLTMVAVRLLTIAPVTVAQRSALFTILANQPDISLRAKVSDATGRIGTAVKFPYGPSDAPFEVLTLLIAQDGTVLELGDVTSQTTYLEVHGYSTPPAEVPSMVNNIR